MTQIRIAIGVRTRLRELAERAPGVRTVSDLIDLLSHAEPRHLADIMTAATAAVRPMGSEMPSLRRGKSYQCGFCWIHPHANGRTLHTCIRHQGHDHAHSDVLGNTPTVAEYDAAKADGAKDC